MKGTDDIVVQIPSEANNSQAGSSNLELTETFPSSEVPGPKLFTTESLMFKGIDPRVRMSRVIMFIESIMFVCILGVFIASLTIGRLRNSRIWGLHIWKWCALILSIICGRMFTEWFVHILVFLIERNILLKKDMLYYVYGLKKSFQAFIWLGMVLLVWFLLFDLGVERSKNVDKIVNYVTRVLGSCLVGLSIWILKTFLVKLLAASFYISKFFDRIQELVSHQYVFNAILGPYFLSTLSGPPLMEMAQMISASPSRQKSDALKNLIDANKLKKMKREKVSAWKMQSLFDMIMNTRLSFTSYSLDLDVDDGEKKVEISSETEAKIAAERIFRNIAQPGSRYIYEDDLLRFMSKEEVYSVFLLMEDVNTYKDRELLVRSLKGSMMAIENLNRLASAVMLVLIIIVWLLTMGFLTVQVLVLILSQIVLVSFMFGNTARSVFEAVIFVFVIHPFDVGSQCIISGEEMIVDEINILTTVFIKQDGKKVHYPNSVLISQPITNFHGSIETQDTLEFDVLITESQIYDLKKEVKRYIESKPLHWHPEHTVEIRKVEDEYTNMVLCVAHNIDIHSSGKKSTQRSELVKKLKMIFEELGIKYRHLR